MAQSGGFSVEVRALRRIASGNGDGSRSASLPDASGEIGSASKELRDLYVQPQGAFGGNAAGVELGKKRNHLLATLISGGLAVSESLDEAARRLDVIADAYERIEREITGK
ncbi:hypothetical protein [Amycolatopsis sp. cmx-4-54]|uniref:hypothetical protein n=1 Tax=Amycolatopsis sp. cmx-4-54 TaxID=2790936 RepID=UPI00397E8093